MEKQKLEGVGIAGAIINILNAALVVIIGLVFVIMFIFAGVMVSTEPTNGEDTIVFIIFTLFGLVFLVIGTLTILFNTFVLMGKLKYKMAAIITGGICGLFGSQFSIIGAVLLAVSKEQKPVSQEDYYTYYNPNHYQKPIEQPKPVEPTKESIPDQIERYKKLHDQGNITDEEYAKIKEKLLSQEDL